MGLSSHILLMGLRGSGKTTMARRLSATTGAPAIDLDDLVAAAAGEPTVGGAYRALGEARFREVEGALLAERLREPPHVLALGGGTPTAPGAADLIGRAASRGAMAVYLRAAPGTLRARLERTDLTARPSLTGLGVLEEIEAVFAQRDGPYRALASHTIECDTLTEAEVEARILSAAGTSAG